MLGERNLLQLKVSGKNISDLEAFQQKYFISFRLSPPLIFPMFNHPIDELEKSPPMAYTVQVPDALAPTGAVLSKKEKTAQKAAKKVEKDRKEEKKEKETKKAAVLAAAAAAKIPPKGGSKGPPRPKGIEAQHSELLKL